MYTWANGESSSNQLNALAASTEVLFWQHETQRAKKKKKKESNEVKTTVDQAAEISNSEPSGQEYRLCSKH